MKRNLLLGTFLCLGSALWAQSEITDEILIKQYMNSVTSKELKSHLYTIASDEMEGRESGSQGQKKAGKYLIEQYIKNEIGHPKTLKDYYQTVPLPQGITSENIFAFIEGTEKPDEIVVVSAHYDHLGIRKGKIHNGADDDGSGTVALLEIAQAFQQAKRDGHGPKRSVLIFHTTGEEKGLLGSNYYSQNPVFPLKNTIADVNIDMIGRSDEFHQNSNHYVYLIGSDYLSTDLYRICESANSQTVNLKLDYRYNDKNDPNRFYYRSDHYNFAKNGIPSVFIFSGVHEDYHQSTDDPEKIDYQALEKRTKLAFAIVWELANREKKPIVDKTEN